MGSNIRLVSTDSNALGRDPRDLDDNPFAKITAPITSRVKQIWAIGGGKGGVGKSMISASLSIALARTGHKIIAVDTDLGGANLHTALGVPPPTQGLGDFFSGRTQRIADCVTPTGFPNLELISGAQDGVGSAQISNEKKIEFLQNVRELDADYLIFDLGAGTGTHTLDFFLAADIGIVTVLPEPTSIENAYRFIKSVYYRRLRISPKLFDIRDLIGQAMEGKSSQGIHSPTDLYHAAARFSPDLAQALKEEVEKFRIKLILNQARTQADVEIGYSIKSVCRKYFGIEIDYAGFLDYDSAVWQAVRRKRPLMLEFPNSQLVSSLERIANFLVKRFGHIRNSIL